MTRPQIRASQIITTFGPGAMVDLPDKSVIITGLDEWRYDPAMNPAVTEPRLLEKLRVLLQRPDLDLRKPPAASDDPSREFTSWVKAYEFPEWFIVQKRVEREGRPRARQLVHKDRLKNGKFHDGDKNRSVVPIRFVRACPKGHVGDIAWFQVLHPKGEACYRDIYVEEHGTTGDLSEISVRCECGGELRMSIAAKVEHEALGRCDGERAWLGPFAKEPCGQPNRLLIRTASNAWFSQTMSVISIPEGHGELDEVVAGNFDALADCAASPETLGVLRKVPGLKQKLERWTDAEILAAVRRRGAKDSDQRKVKDVEFDVLADAREELGTDRPEGDFYARALPRADWDAPWMAGVKRIVLVHRLREVMALAGFTRFEAAGPDISGELDVQVERAPLAIDARWLPAVENRGEGIFLELDPEAVQAWAGRTAVMERSRVLHAGFDAWLHDHEGSKREFPHAVWYLAHTLSHLLMASISVECGYPATSLRERVYATEGRYGILIFTASPDAEGTLGGLVLAGRDIRRHLRMALEAGRLCSNDPVCAQNEPAGPGGRQLLGAACHGCTLASEPSCEQRNDWLDRALVVPTVGVTDAAFFGDAL